MALLSYYAKLAIDKSHSKCSDKIVALSQKAIGFLASAVDDYLVYYYICAYRVYSLYQLHAVPAEYNCAIVLLGM